MIVAQLAIPQMFTAYAEDLEYLQSGLHQYQYFCEECDQAFSSAWGKIPNSMSWFERGRYFYCPYCGHRHGENVAYIKRHTNAPYKVRLVVREFKDAVTFEVICETARFVDYLSLFEGTRKEVYRFDVVKQQVTLTVWEHDEKQEPILLGNPFKLEMLDSILYFFTPASIPNTSHKAALNDIIKTLRETVHRKLEKRLGHKISSMYVSPGQYYGTFLLPLFNMAYRVACPDAPNLPVVYRESRETIRKFWVSKMLTDGTKDNYLELSKHKWDSISALILAKKLPDRPILRRVLTEDPFDIDLLSRAFELCENYDYAVQMFTALKALGSDMVYSRQDELFIPFLREMKFIYNENGIVHLLEKAQELRLWDCINLYDQLNDENKKALKTANVRLRDLHDWLSITHLKQNHKNIKFDVPNHIVNRLSMQADRLKFFMPKESIELVEAGHLLHNCVASYGKAMKENRSWIVLIADDKGKLAACLEIRGKELVQAKINQNKSVSVDEKLNQAVLDWAKEANLEIKTPDIKVKKSIAKISVPA